ncbi:MAG: hypothetical protein D6767_07810 [Candidatus Hydrogenedentota bacterium]|nr:MAG: hypothetical protein D6767_07810 [Candidatus Hydrogenedentota bacterium]
MILTSYYYPFQEDFLLNGISGTTGYFFKKDGDIFADIPTWFLSHEQKNEIFRKLTIIQMPQRPEKLKLPNSKITALLDRAKEKLFFNPSPLPTQAFPKIKSNFILPDRIPFRKFQTLIQEAYQKGFFVFKIKLRPQNLIKLKNILSTFPYENFPKIQFRFDGNQSLNYDDLKNFISVIPKERIDYIEDPFAKEQDKKIWIENQKVQLAADESFLKQFYATGSAEEAISNIPEEILIVKPSWIGANFLVYQLVKVARKLKKRVIFTSVFESPYGIYDLQKLALEFRPDEVHGLSLNIFQDDFAEQA